MSIIINDKSFIVNNLIEISFKKCYGIYEVIYLTNADRIDELLQEKDWSRRKLAKEAKIPPSTLQSAMERGEITNTELLKKIAAALNKPVIELMGVDDMGSRIRQLREAHKLTHHELSQKTSIPVRTLKQYEKAILDPKAKDLQLIALALNESIGALIGYGDDDLAIALISEHPDDVVILDDRGTPHFYYEESLEQQKQLDSFFMKLNKEGRQIAVERVEELTYIPKYQKKEKDS